MIELPEAIVFARQLDELVKGKTIDNAIRGHTPHTFIFPQDREQLEEKGWDTDNPYQVGEENKGREFTRKLKGITLGKSWAVGNQIHIEAGKDYILTLGVGGEKIIYHKQEKTLPKRHQLLLAFEDGTFLSVTISGWGMVRLASREQLKAHLTPTKIDPLSDEFTREVFEAEIKKLPRNRKRSAKKFYITDPGFEGVGNGVIQDIFFVAGIHPAREMISLGRDETAKLYESTRNVLQEMVDKGGRSTEKDIYGKAGGYKNILHSKTAGTPCPECRTIIEKKQYLGGSIYFCPGCQKL